MGDFYDSRVTQKRLLADRLIAPSHGAKEAFYPTVAGALFFCDEPDRYIPEAIVICTRFKGKQGRNILFSEEVYGPLDQIASDAFSLVSSWLEGDYKLEGVKLKGSLPIPRVALREAIMNALIHKKYSVPGAVKIAVYDDRLEIFNPGCFPGVVDLDDLGDGTTYLRNPNLAKIARKMGLVEKLGSGIRLIFDSCHKAKVKRPEYREGGNFVKLTFFFMREKNDDQSDGDAVLNLLKNKKEVTVNDVKVHLGVSRNTASRRLAYLVENKKVVRYGKGPAVRYKLY